MRSFPLKKKWSKLLTVYIQVDEELGQQMAPDQNIAATYSLARARPRTHIPFLPPSIAS